MSDCFVDQLNPPLLADSQTFVATEEMRHKAVIQFYVLILALPIMDHIAKSIFSRTDCKYLPIVFP